MAKTTKTTGKTGSNVTALDTGKPAARKMAGGGRNAISIIAITLISRQPMLQNALSEVALDGLPGGSGKLTKPNLKEMTYEERAELARYHGPGDEFGFPADCLFAALVHAGKFVKFDGKKNFTNAEMSILPGFLTINNEFLAFKDQDKKSWIVDKRRAVNPATGGAMCVIRPKFAKWEVEVEIEINHAGGVKLEQVRQLFEEAGRQSGIGDHRKKGSFGRFRIAKWAVVEEKSEEVAAAA
ncbi:hypothetical protein A3H77_00280 [Candidatus Kaiserbacteria bacterium RIFCSPLOWO2_02_FULL_56_11]|uniref:Uncharacterized protein n=2 Tax=Candidatus Kaiseribacteriota TaxID=1752734 RepID=A0A1F6E3I0_9BACT|nr:MAG: hypothetical protein A3C95_01365 [Candidatus Kaiserbacteria bacterium RIFCSPHIGHO2_02_FULL_56_30]OGG72368.1 MAG: hypothetical protein A3E65_01550 [Candidatus Kaiserbacteria bacterium RIFCSPHIGHO2_12_FULL_56_13]OGG80840.1 MAG: hypothetical protein A3H77_00280 [Candidatus Kaiserbacteria bacterium RIFCSPLOWO2_02_FULL_56_11]